MKYQKQTVVYCLLFSASITIGQATNTSLSCVSLVAPFIAFVIILAAVNACKHTIRK